MKTTWSAPREKVKLCGKNGGTDAGHLCICSAADWHLEAGLKHGCDCGRSWKDEEEPLLRAIRDAGGGKS